MLLDICEKRMHCSGGEDKTTVLNILINVTEEYTVLMGADETTVSEYILIDICD